MPNSALYLLRAGVWQLAGSGPPPTGPLPPGSYQPGAATTGYAGTVLTAQSGDIVTSYNGQIITGLNLAGKVVIKHADVTVQYNKIRGGAKVGGTTNVGLVDCNDANCLRATIADNELIVDPAQVSTGWNGVLGHDYTASRNNIANVVDGFGAYNSHNAAQDLEVVIEANWVHDFAQLSPDPNHTDLVGGVPTGWTHNDGLQIQSCGATKGRRQVYSHGNNYQCFASPLTSLGGVSNFKTAYFPSVTGQCIGVTPNLSQIHDVVSDGDWMDGGAQSVTVILSNKGVGTGLVFVNGRYGRGQPSINLGGVSARRAMRIDPTVTIAGLPTTTGLDKAAADGGSGNVYTDTGGPVTVYRIT